MTDGILIVDKPEGMTSADVVRAVKQRLRCKTGHLGTLDPFASGVLPICVGEGTKIAQFLNTADKAYTGRIRLGSETDSGDLTGNVTATVPGLLPQPTPAQLEQVAARWRGESLQVPPMYSAVKQQGTPLYKLARRGIVVERQARRIRIDTLELHCDESGAIGFHVSCSKGTYIRVLAQQIAVALGSVGHLETLRRTRFGHFDLSQAVSMEAVGTGAAPVVGLRTALPHLREIELDADRARRAHNGYEPVLDSLPLGDEGGPVKLIGPKGELAAVIARDPSGKWRYARVFRDVESRDTAADRR